MSKFLIDRLLPLAEYVPGEQPKDTQYIKLNTNESPFNPSAKTVEYAHKAAKNLQLYSDPQCTSRVKIATEKLNV